LWNDQILTDRRRYSSSAMFIRAEVVSYETILKQQLRDDPRVWPRPLAKPDPRYVVTAAKVPTTSRPVSAESSSLSARKLRPAMDVLSRLRHDTTFDLDDYVVGYTDRHAGIMEKAAGAWVSESTHEEWIPQGRIQYFKRVSDEVRVWDRATKTDFVFR
jgi:uncharacterized protein (UPF0248 family)